MKLTLQTLRNEFVLEKGITPEDFLLLALHILQIDRAAFFREKDFALAQEQATQLKTLLERRLNCEPVAYLLGEKEFYGNTFKVTPDTLIPRPESECMIEDILAFNQNIQTSTPDCIFDIGAGSGALIISLAANWAHSPTIFFASDTSLKALEIAKENASRILPKKKVTFLKGSLLKPYVDLLQGSEQEVYIVANLPYVSSELFEAAPLDVKNFEPRSALLSEDRGLAHYRHLFQELKQSDLSGWCWIEISPEQEAELVQTLGEMFAETEPYVGLDLAQNSRFVRFAF